MQTSLNSHNHSTPALALTSDEASRPLLEIKARPVYTLAKRVLETFVAFSILILLSPLWLLVSLAIRLTSPGPVLFRGQVVGKDGREFTYYKFRSMAHNNDNTQHRFFIERYVQTGLKTTVTASADSSVEPIAAVSPAEERAAPAFKLTGDDRVTRVGRIIRKLSLDEVPQMLNVIRGEMAIVGPRPPVVYEYKIYDDWCKQRLSVRPGITGLAQVRARGRATFDQMVALDLQYIQTRSLRGDLKIMLITPWTMLKGI